MNFKAICGAIAIVACGIVKEAPAEEFRPLTAEDCTQRGMAAFALAKARDHQRPRQQFLNYIATQEPDYKHEVLNYITNYVFDHKEKEPAVVYADIELWCMEKIK